VFRPINAAKKILYFLLVLSFVSCTNGVVDPFDRSTGLSRADATKGMLKNTKEERLKKLQKNQDEAPIPSASKFITAPPPPAIGSNKTISFSVTDQAPLKDVLIELGRIAKIDVDLDPSISGGIIINAKNRPLREVIDRIATLGKLRYSYKNGVLHFERDTPYMKNYFVDYLSGSTLWTDVEKNVGTIIASHKAKNSSGASSTSDNSSNTNNDSNVNDDIPSFSSNRSAGIIALFATAKQHEQVATYLSDVQKYASAQVLIEAKVVEVTLNDEFRAGINWNVLGKKNNITAQNANTIKGNTPITYIATELFNTDLSTTITALETFGLAKAISSPRINAINNQKATLDFSEKLIYFTVSTSANTVGAGLTGATTIATVTATKNEVPVGVQLSITPSINLSTNEITMNIVPKLSVDSGRTIPDPSVNPNTGDSLGNTVPIIKTRELSTIAKVQSGNILVIGGLMSDTTNDTDTGIPFISRIPVLGWLFKSTTKVSSTVETVIFIKATIINSGNFPDKVDRDFEKFDPNKRRFFE